MNRGKAAERLKRLLARREYRWPSGLAKYIEEKDVEAIEFAIDVLEEMQGAYILAGARTMRLNGPLTDVIALLCEINIAVGGYSKCGREEFIETLPDILKDYLASKEEEVEADEM